MVCDRCKMTVNYQLAKLGITPTEVHLGEVYFNQNLTVGQIEKIEKVLQPLGFEILRDRKYQVIESIKNLITQQLYYGVEKMKLNLSEFISKKLNKEYAYLSSLFSEVEGITIEKYFILQKIERAKELLMYNEYTLSEIAYSLGYSSPAHLSNQFKKITGLTPTYFKKQKENKRTAIDKLEIV
jgi:AraC-like DNA-binding protein